MHLQHSGNNSRTILTEWTNKIFIKLTAVPLPHWATDEDVSSSMFKMMIIVVLMWLMCKWSNALNSLIWRSNFYILAPLHHKIPFIWRERSHHILDWDDVLANLMRWISFRLNHVFTLLYVEAVVNDHLESWRLYNQIMDMLSPQSTGKWFQLALYHLSDWHRILSPLRAFISLWKHTLFNVVNFE